MIRKIIKIHGLEYFIEFNIWNDKHDGRHRFCIILRSNVLNPNTVNIRYSNFQYRMLNGINIIHDGPLSSKEVKRLVLNFFTGSQNQNSVHF